MDFVFELLDLDVETWLEVGFLLVWQLLAVLNFFDLGLDFDVTFLELDSLGAEHVNVIVKAVVLFLCLDEGGHDLFNIGNARGVFDLVECIFDNFDVAQILVH